MLTSNFQKVVSVRSRTAYKTLLKTIPNPQVLQKPELEITFLTMCGGKHLKLLQQCLFSLYSSWSSIPKLHIVSDGTIKIAQLEKALAWWTGTKSFSSWERSVSYHRQKNRKFLVGCTEKSILGRKLAVILESAEAHPTLWCDCDILWFKDFSELGISLSNSRSPALKISLDYQKGYDEHLIQEKKLFHLNQPPFINSGLVFAWGNLLDTCQLKDVLAVAAQSSAFWTEQTIFAEAAHRLRASFWSSEEIACFEDDKFSLVPDYSGKKWFARHYAGPTRHLFFRDAFLLRLGLKQRLFQEKLPSLACDSQ